MKKNNFFFILFVVFLVFLRSFSYSEQKKGWDECNNLLIFLQANDYPAEKNPIINNTSAEFPFNIKIVFFPEASKTSKNIMDNSEEIDTLVFLFSIEEVQQNYDFLLKILDSIRNFSRKGKIEILFTYGDRTASETESLISGTEVFAEQIEDSDNHAVICVKLNSPQNSILPGGGGDCSPAWMIQLISGSFHENNMFYRLKGGILNTLHRLEILKSDRQTGFFLKKGIPACGVELYSPTKNEEYNERTAKFISSVSYNFDPENTIKWDRHSRPFIFFNYTVLLSEKFTVILFIFVSAVCLFFLCEFYFIRLLQRKLFSRRILKKWYLLIFCLIFTVISFWLGQYAALFFQKILGSSIISAYAVKLIFTFLLISCTYFLFFKLTRNSGYKLFSMLINATGILNIFLFSALDLSLFYLFAAEYFIIAVTQKFKKMPFLITSFFLMAVPFLPYLIEFLTCATEDSLEKILLASPLINTIFAFAFIPFELMWFKILGRLNFIWKSVDSGKKTFIKQNFIAISTAFLIFAVILISATAFMPDEYKRPEKKPPETEISGNSERIHISYYDQDFFGDTIRTFSVKLENPEETVSIRIKGKNGNPVLYSDEAYYYDASEKNAVFRLPVWPPEEMTFSYIADIFQESEIIVSETNFSDSGKFLVFENSMKIPAKSAHEEKGIRQ